MRSKAIDLLRGLGILTIILIHVTAWYTQDKTAHFIWNWGQFAVPAFVFCSTYLFYTKKEKYEKEGFVNYSLIRLKRLLPSYYVFLVFFYLIYLLKKPLAIHWQDVLMNLTLTTPGHEPNWAILLFILITILMFPLTWLLKKSKSLFIFYAVLALTSSLLLVFYRWPFNYKLIMLLPWSLVILFSWYFSKYEGRRAFYPLTFFVLVIIFTIAFAVQNRLGNDLLFISNKYPPNLYYLSYGMLSVTLIYYLAKKGLFDFFQKPIYFLSVNSYHLFFIHLFLIIAASEFIQLKQLAWWQFFAIIFALTLAVQLVLNKIRS